MISPWPVSTPCPVVLDKPAGAKKGRKKKTLFQSNFVYLLGCNRGREKKKREKGAATSGVRRKAGPFTASSTVLRFLVGLHHDGGEGKGGEKGGGSLPPAGGLHPSPLSDHSYRRGRREPAGKRGGKRENFSSNAVRLQLHSPGLPPGKRRREGRLRLQVRSTSNAWSSFNTTKSDRTVKERGGGGGKTAPARASALVSLAAPRFLYYRASPQSRQARRREGKRERGGATLPPRMPTEFDPAIRPPMLPFINT